MKKIFAEVVLFLLVGLFMIEMWILIPVFCLLYIITGGKDLSNTKRGQWLVNWFDDYVERNTTTKK